MELAHFFLFFFFAVILMKLTIQCNNEVEYGGVQDDRIKFLFFEILS